MQTIRDGVADCSLVLAAGRVVPAKGFDVLVEAMRSLGRADVRCVIVGEAPDRSYLASLQQRSDRQTSFVGSLARGDLLELMSSASVVVVPSRFEPFGLVALEAISAGARVVASDVGGLRDFIREPFGLLVPPDDVVSLATAIVGALSKGRLGFAELHWAKALLEEYSWPVVTEQYERVLYSIVRPPL